MRRNDIQKSHPIRECGTISVFIEPLCSDFAVISNQFEAADLRTTMNADWDSKISDATVHIKRAAMSLIKSAHIPEAQSRKTDGDAINIRQDDLSSMCVASQCQADS